jgi:YD repeat-containing protein
MIMARVFTKRSFACLGVILLCASLLEAQTKSDKELDGLTGPVRSVRVEESKVLTDAGQTRETPRVLRQILVFDERGNVTEQSVYNPDGSLQRKLGWARVYDAANRETEKSYYNADHVLTSKGVSVYDAKGRAVETTFYSPRGSVNHVEAYFYDDGGNRIREVHRNPDGTARVTIINGYDAQGRLTEHTFYDGQGALTQKSIFTYDDHGSQTAWTVYQKDGTPVQVRRKSLSYDEKGNITEAINFGRDNSVTSRETFTYVFDSHGNWIKKSTRRETFKGASSEIESLVTYVTITYF